MIQFDEPDWEPLLNVVEQDVVGDFMWMCEVELADGTRIHCYKHRWNRQSLHLSARGEAFYFVWTADDDDYDPDEPSRYQPVRLSFMLRQVLGWPAWPEERRSRDIEESLRIADEETAPEHEPKSQRG